MYFIAKIDPKLCSMTHTWKYLTNKYACDMPVSLRNIYFYFHNMLHAIYVCSKEKEKQD